MNKLNELAEMRFGLVLEGQQFACVDCHNPFEGVKTRLETVVISEASGKKLVTTSKNAVVLSGKDGDGRSLAGQLVYLNQDDFVFVYKRATERPRMSIMRRFNRQFKKAK